MPEPKTCQKCGEVFLTQDNDRRKTEGLRGARLDRVQYCSRKCARAAAQAALRARQRAS